MGNMPCCSTPVLGDCVSTISTCEVEEVKPSQPGRWISVDRLCQHKILKIKKMAISEVSSFKDGTDILQPFSYVWRKDTFV